MGKIMSSRSGIKAEKIACAYLQRQGLSLIKRNFRVFWGEIDLIMQENETLVFVEVRYRRQGSYGGSLESVTQHKQNKLIKAALVYLQRHPCWQQSPMRFDVVGLDGDNSVVSQWVKNAFFADGF